MSHAEIDVKGQSMVTSPVQVMPSGPGAWLVKRAAEQNAIETFRHRAHALAFGRALAFSGRVDLLVYEADGSCARQDRKTLTYPSSLD